MFLSKLSDLWGLKCTIFPLTQRTLDLCMSDLWLHQSQALEKASNLNEFGLLLPMGVGKTRTAIEILRQKCTNEKRLLRTLIVGPKIVQENWKREILRFSKIPAHDIVVLTGTGPKREQKFARECTDDTGRKNKVVIIGFQSLLMKDLVKCINWWNPELIICDESHRIKNPTAKTTKALISLGDEARFRYILTGTPILNTMMDIYSQYRFLDKGETFGRNFFVFRNTYFFDKNAGMPSQKHFPDWKLKTGALETVSEKIFKKAIHVKKEDCIDLPPFVRKHVYVEMSPEQKRHYEEMKKHFITVLGDKACTAQLAITKALRLQQIVSGFIKTEDGTEVVLKDNPRREALKELLEDLTPEHKVIVWACFKENYESIRGVCRELGIAAVELHGQTSDKQRQEAIDSFNNNPTIRVFIGNQLAGGIGVNLIASDYSIYYSRNFSLEQDMQSESRNYRAGSTLHSKITRIDLVCAATIDESVLEALANKQEISDKVLRSFKL